jgi:hypothetical protein
VPDINEVKARPQFEVRRYNGAICASAEGVLPRFSCIYSRNEVEGNGGMLNRVGRELLKMCMTDPIAACWLSECKAGAKEK